MSPRENILLHSEELFSEFGFEGTSVRAIASKAKVNVAMIYYYFGSKEKLFEALVEYRTSVLHEQFINLHTNVQDPMERIENVVDMTVDRILSNPKFHKVIHRQIGMQQRSELSEHLVGNLMKNMNEIRKMILDGIKSKAFRDVDIELLIICMFSTTSQLAHSSLLCSKMLGNPKKSDPENEQLRKRLKIFLKDLLQRFLLIKEKKNK